MKNIKRFNDGMQSLQKSNMNQALIIGVTGSYCSGKSSICNKVIAILSKKSILHIEVDHLGHEILEIEIDAIVKRFGSEIIHSPDVKIDDSKLGIKTGTRDRTGTEGQTFKNPTIDRKKLGQIVFNDPKSLKDLEAILHPAMISRVDKMIEVFVGDYVIINAAILHKMGLDSRCDIVWFVDAPFIVRVVRAIRRDKLQLSVAVKRIRDQNKILAQLPEIHADIRKVSNWGGKRFLERNARNLIRELWNKNEVSS